MYMIYLFDSLTEASCRSPPGTGREKNVLITVGNQTSDDAKLWSYLGTN